MTGVLAIVLALAADAPPAGAVKLLDGAAEFAQAEGNPITLDGVIERNPATGRIGKTARLNVFRLRHQDLEGKAAVRELYLGEVGFRVADHLGQKVRVHGKLVELKSDSGNAVEVWPAWLQPLSGPLLLGVDGVFARCDWQPEEARKRGTKQYVFRTAEQLAEAMRISGSSTPRTASEMLARRLAIPAIDWDRHMLVCVSAGLQTTVEGLTISRVHEQAGVLRVGYRLLPAKGAGFGYPAQSVLVPRSSAEVRFELEALSKR